MHFSGETVNGYPHGHGTMTTSDGVRAYEGSWFCGKRCGFGVSRLDAFGTLSYRGDWKHDLYDGEGEEFDADGDIVYRGRFVEGQRSGYGTLYANGDVQYVGEWKEGRFEGTGTMYNIKNGKRMYHGSWCLGRRHGDGTSFSKSEKKEEVKTYEGQWVFDKAQGFGTLMKKGRVFYTGQMFSNAPHGIGKLFDDDGNLVFSGHIENSSPHGYGSLYKDGKMVFQGEWIRGIRHGEGKCFLTNCTGVWNYGRFLRSETVEDIEKQNNPTSPRCMICQYLIIPGSSSYAFSGCGHRCICFACQSNMPDDMKLQCVVCRTPGNLFFVHS
jgi:hypothetical protein